MDVVSRHVSDDVHGHQCSHSSNWLHYIPSGADTQPVVDPVNGAEIEAGSGQTACGWSFRHYFTTWCHHVLFWLQKPTVALAFNWSGLEASFRYCDVKSTFFSAPLNPLNQSYPCMFQCVVLPHPHLSYNSVFSSQYLLKMFNNMKTLYLILASCFSAVSLPHLVIVDCDPSTFMLMLSSFQRSYCTLLVPSGSIWEVILLFRGLSSDWRP